MDKAMQDDDQVTVGDVYLTFTRGRNEQTSC